MTSPKTTKRTKDIPVWARWTWLGLCSVHFSDVRPTWGTSGYNGYDRVKPSQFEYGARNLPPTTEPQRRASLRKILPARPQRRQRGRKHV